MDVHRVRFVEATPAAIHRVCFSQRGSRPKLAVGRGDGSVEVSEGDTGWIVMCLAINMIM